jgi:hypothetical protein
MSSLSSAAFHQLYYSSTPLLKDAENKTILRFALGLVLFWLLVRAGHLCSVYHYRRPVCRSVFLYDDRLGHSR